MCEGMTFMVDMRKRAGKISLEASRDKTISFTVCSRIKIISCQTLNFFSITFPI